jgi:hypothetical protein
MKNHITILIISLIYCTNLFGQIEFSFDKLYYHPFDTIKVAIKNPQRLVFQHCKKELIYTVNSIDNQTGTYQQNYWNRCDLDLPPQYLNDSIIQINIANSFQNRAGIFVIELKNVLPELAPELINQPLNSITKHVTSFYSESIYVLPKPNFTIAPVPPVKKQIFYYYEKSKLKKGIVYENYFIVGNSRKSATYAYEVYTDYFGLKEYVEQPNSLRIEFVKESAFDPDLQRILYIAPNLYREVTKKLFAYGKFCTNDKGQQTILTNRLYLKLKNDLVINETYLKKIEALKLTFENYNQSEEFNTHPFDESIITLNGSLIQMKKITETLIKTGYFEEVSTVFIEPFSLVPYNK